MFLLYMWYKSRKAREEKTAVAKQLVTALSLAQNSSRGTEKDLTSTLSMPSPPRDTSVPDPYVTYNKSTVPSYTRIPQSITSPPLNDQVRDELKVATDVAADRKYASKLTFTTNNMLP
mgnify:CR=1 FL=1